MQKQKKLISFITLLSFFIYLLSPILRVYSEDLSHLFDQNSLNIYAFVSNWWNTPNFLTAWKLDLTKANNSKLIFRTNNYWWWVNNWESWNDKLEINSNEAIALDEWTLSNYHVIEIKNEKDSNNSFENFSFKAFDASFNEVTLNVFYDRSASEKTIVNLKSSLDFRYIVVIWSDDWINILWNSISKTNCTWQTTVTNLTKYGYANGVSYMSWSKLNLSNWTASFWWSQNNPIDWWIQTTNSDKSKIDFWETFVLDFNNSSV